MADFDSATETMAIGTVTTTGAGAEGSTRFDVGADGTRRAAGGAADDLVVRRERTAVLVALLISVVPAAAIAGRGVWRGVDGALHAALFDDAMISMSYARAAASGGGLVWFDGADRVEGITNPGWTAVMAVVHGVGLDRTGAVLAMMAIALACVWGAALVGHRWVRSAGLLPPGRLATFASVAAVTLNIPLLFWAVRGMEVGAIVLLTLLTCATAHRAATATLWSFRDALGLAAVVGAGVLVRSDFVVVAAAVGAWLVLAPGLVRRRAPFAMLAGAAAATLIGVTAARMAYYGQLLPNTYYLKVEGIDLGNRLTRGIVVDLITAAPYVLAPLALITLAWASLRRAERNLVGLALTVAGALVAYSTYVGGDAWEQFLIPNRYLTPAVVLLVLVAVSTTFAVWARSYPETESERSRWRSRWAWCALGIGAAPMLAAVSSVSLGRLVPRIGGLETSVDAALVVPTLVCLLVGAGVAARLRGKQAGPTSQVVVRRAAGAMAMLLLFVTGARAIGLGQDGSVRFAALGEHLGAVTLPGATIAAGGVGGVQYWSERPVLDVLGKSDERIARSAPVDDSFLPGHDKYDTTYILDELRPDVVAQGVPSDELLRRGYVPARSLLKPFAEGVGYREEWVVFVRPDSSGVRWDLLERID